MKRTTFNYDELSDTLYVSFFPGETGTGIELNDHIVLRIDLKKLAFHVGNHSHCNAGAIGGTERNFAIIPL